MDSRYFSSPNCVTNLSPEFLMNQSIDLAINSTYMMLSQIGNLSRFALLSGGKYIEELVAHRCYFLLEFLAESSIDDTMRQRKLPFLLSPSCSLVCFGVGGLLALMVIRFQS